MISGTIVILMGAKKYTFCRFTQPGIFLWWNAHDRCRIYRFFFMGDGRDMKAWITIGQGIITGMISKRTFPYQFFIRINISFNNKISIGRHFHIRLCDTFYQFHFFLS